MKFTTEELRAEIEAGRLPGIAVAIEMCDEIDRLKAALIDVAAFLVAMNAGPRITKIVDDALALSEAARDT